MQFGKVINAFKIITINIIKLNWCNKKQNIYRNTIQAVKIKFNKDNSLTFLLTFQIPFANLSSYFYIIIKKL